MSTRRDDYMSIITKLLIKIFNKFPTIKEELKNEFTNDAENKRKREEFNKIRIGDMIISETPDFAGDDYSHLIRPFVVVGRTEDAVYALYGTTQDKSDFYYYYESYDAHKSTYTYYDCSKILKFTKADYIKTGNRVSEYTLSNLYDMLVTNCDCLGIIDKRYLKKDATKGSVVAVDDKIYMIMSKNNKRYRVVQLIESENPRYYERILGKKYTLIPESSTEINCDRVNYILKDVDEIFIEKVKKELKKVANAKEIPFSFSDIIVINGSKEKGICLCADKNYVYYVTFDTLDLFAGIKKIEINKANNTYEKLSYENVAKLVNKIDKKLDNNSKYVDEKLAKKIKHEYKKER